MEIYIILLVTFIIFAILSMINDKVLNKLMFIISFLLFTIFSGLRWERGTDWNQYLDIFQHFTQSYEFNGFDPGYVILMRLAYLISEEYSFFLFICAVIIFIFYFKFISSFSSNAQLSILALWCLSIGTFFFVRQTIAAGILLYSLKFVVDKKPIKFMITVFIAGLFHISGVIFLITWFLIKENWNIKIFSIFLILLFTAFLYVNNNELYINKALIYFDPLYSESVKEQFNTNTESSFVAILNRLIIIIICIFFLKKSSKQIQLVKMIYYFGCVIYLISELSYPIIGRLIVYFDVMQIILIPEILNKIHKSYIRNIFFINTIAYMILRYYRAITGAYTDLYIPYKSIFYNMDIPVILF